MRTALLVWLAVSTPQVFADESEKKDPGEFEILEKFVRQMDTDVTKNCTGDRCALVTWARNNAKLYNHCASYFVGEDGKIGELSRLVSKRVAEDILAKRDKSPYSQRYPDIDENCPGYTDMDATSRTVFWTWIMEILGFFETTCTPGKKNYALNVPNKPAAGLYQLEYWKKIREWRGPNCRVSEEKIMTADGNTACALDILEFQLKRFKRLFGARDSKDKLMSFMYWESFNPPATLHLSDAAKKSLMVNSKHFQFKKYLARFPLCQKKAGPKVNVSTDVPESTPAAR